MHKITIECDQPVAWILVRALRAEAARDMITWSTETGDRRLDKQNADELYGLMQTLEDAIGVAESEDVAVTLRIWEEE